MSKNEDEAYEHYVALCIGHCLPPLSFDKWRQLIGPIENTGHRGSAHETKE
jgi:hypothetical protein